MKYIVTDVKSGIKYYAKAEESIFAALHKSGRSPFKGGCAGGGCGICKIKVIEGRFDAFKKMSRAHVSQQEEENGIVLACCIKPASDILFQTFD